MTKPILIVLTTLLFAGGALHADLCSCLGKISSKVSVVDSLVDLIDSKLDTLSTGSPCNPVGLSQTDFTPGSPPTLEIGSSGTTYCFTENLTGTITLSGPDITLDLNGHELNGRINVIQTAVHAIIKDGTIISPAPVNSPDAVQGVIFIQSAGETLQPVGGTHVMDCSIICTTPSSTQAIDGMRGIYITGNGTIIERCFIQAGPSSQALDSDTSPSATGGVGIRLEGGAFDSQIIDCTIYGGAGADSDGTSVSCDGGDGIDNFAQGIIVSQCLIVGGNAGATITNGNDIFTSRDVTLGNGGHGLLNDGLNCTFTQLIVQGGNGGGIDASPSGRIAATGSVRTGIGGDAFHINGGSDSVMSSSTLIGGPSGSLIGGDIAATLATFTIGTGGNGCLLTNCSNSLLVDCGISSGNSGNATALGGGSSDGSLGSSGSNTLSSSGSGVAIITGIFPNNNNFIGNCLIKTGSSGSASATFNIVNLFIEAAGAGILNNSGTDTIIDNCQIITGDGGSMTADNLIASTSVAGNGGAGLDESGSFTIMNNSSIVTGNGGNVTTPTILGAPVNAGDGGIGVIIENAANGSQIRTTSIGQTGNGGSPNNASGGNGNGGSGIFVGSTAGSNFLIELSNNKISYTGQAGTGGIGGFSGIAIDDETANATIYGNFADNIAGSPAYILQAGTAVDQPNGTAFLSATNLFQNVHNP